MAYNVITPEYFGGGELPTSPTTTVYRTTPVSSRDFLTSISVANSSGSTLNVTVWIVPQGGTAGAGNLLLPAVPVNTSTVFQWRDTQVLEAGDTIVAMASGSGVSIRISGGNAV